jgi:hypothetical protein
MQCYFDLQQSCYTITYYKDEGSNQADKEKANPKNTVSFANEVQKSGTRHHVLSTTS